MISDATMTALQRERVRRVRKAERESGYRELSGHWDGSPCETVVTFYPHTKWWIEVDGKRYPLDDKIWDEIDTELNR